MGCITELLKMKGDNEILRVNDELVIEGGGSYKGYEYIITFTEMGTRCGYVALKPEETERFKSMQNEEDYYPELNCHGGITYFDKGNHLKTLLSNPSDETWVGFDCGHGWDGRDDEMTMKYFNKKSLNTIFIEALKKFPDVARDLERVNNSGFTVRTYQYVEENCHQIIDQLIG